MIFRLLAAAALAVPAAAHEYRAGTIIVDHPVLRVVSPVSKTGAGYLTIRNTGSRADTLLAVTTRAAARSDLHGTVQNGNVMQMRRAAAGVTIPAGGSATFAPGGLHVMFIGLRNPVPAGARIPARLAFARAGKIDVVFTAQGFASP